jgi:hypothetical protein
VHVENLAVPIEFSFPIGDNQNLTEFIDAYNLLNIFKYSERVKKDLMLKKANITCVFWNNDN